MPGWPSRARFRCGLFERLRRGPEETARHGPIRRRVSRRAATFFLIPVKRRTKTARCPAGSSCGLLSRLLSPRHSTRHSISIALSPDRRRPSPSSWKRSSPTPRPGLIPPMRTQGRWALPVGWATASSFVQSARPLWPARPVVGSTSHIMRPPSLSGHSRWQGRRWRHSTSSPRARVREGRKISTHRSWR